MDSMFDINVPMRLIQCFRILRGQFGTQLAVIYTVSSVSSAQGHQQDQQEYR